MPPKKRKGKKQLEEEEDRQFQKAEKKLEQKSKWLVALEEKEEEQPTAEKRMPVFNFDKEQEYLKQEDKRKKRRDELMKLVYEAEQQLPEVEEQFSDQETDEQKAKRMIKREQIKQRKKMKKERERELRRIENELEEEQEKKKKAIQECLMKDKEPKKEGISWITILAVILSFSLLYFFYYVQMRQRLEHFKVSDEDLYAILQTDAAMTDSQLKSQYRRLVLKYHPDTNKQCRDCKEKFDRIMKAWQVIGNSKKRQEYDQSYGHITHIKSSSVTLTERNYHLLVEGSDDLWIIQVYDESDKYSHGFADIWESAVQEFSDFVRFGRVDAWHQQDMLDYIPYSFKLYPSIYSLRRGISNIYSFNFHDLVRTLHTFIEQQLVDTIQAKQIEELDVAETMKDGRALLILPTKKRYMPYQMRAISLRLEKYMKTIKINPQSKSNMLDGKILDQVRLYLNPSNYVEFAIPQKNQDFVDFQRKIVNSIVQQLSVCQLMQHCQSTTCLIILNINSTNQIKSNQHRRVIINDKEFFDALQAFKHQTNQREKFDVAIYMDGKIVLGYFDEVDDMTLDDGDIFLLKCRQPLRLKWKKLICGSILIGIAFLVGNKTWRLIFGVAAVYFFGELLRLVEYYYLSGTS